MINIRKGKGYRWSENSIGPHGFERHASGFTVDNLDTKEISETLSAYEKVFVLVRKILERNESSCMDVEEERLQCCQEIADSLRTNKIIQG